MAKNSFNWNILIIGAALIGGLYFWQKIKTGTPGGMVTDYISGLTGENISDATQGTVRTDLRQTGLTERVTARQTERTDRVSIRQAERTQRVAFRNTVSEPQGNKIIINEGAESLTTTPSTLKSAAQIINQVQPSGKVVSRVTVGKRYTTTYFNSGNKKSLLKKLFGG